MLPMSLYVQTFELQLNACVVCTGTNIQHAVTDKYGTATVVTPEKHDHSEIMNNQSGRKSLEQQKHVSRKKEKMHLAQKTQHVADVSRMWLDLMLRHLSHVSLACGGVKDHLSPQQVWRC